MKPENETNSEIIVRQPGVLQPPGASKQAMTRVFMMLVGFQFISHASQLGTLDVQLTGSGFPTVKVKASDCQNSRDIMWWKGMRCSDRQNVTELQDFVKDVCTEKGGELCLGLDYASESCIMITGMIGEQGVESSELNLDNVTFFHIKDLDRIKAIGWVHQDNKSTLHVTPIKGVPVYKLSLEPIDEKNCTPREIRAPERDGRVTFTSQWDGGELVPGCQYTTLISLEDECGSVLTMERKFEELTLRYQDAAKPSERKEMMEAVDFVMLVAILAVLALLTSVVVLLVLHLAQTRRNSAAETAASSTQEKASIPHIPSPKNTRVNILLVYSPRFRREMAALSSELKKLTRLQIEDLYDPGDEDKLTDPTVWLTRRLMDANTRFVLAVSQKTHEHNESLREGGAFSHLLDHFLQHLQSSSLAYDYTRVHHVRFEDQEDILLSDVTCGRLYQLPAHLPQLARNLVHTEASTPFLDKPSMTPKEQM